MRKGRKQTKQRKKVPKKDKSKEEHKPVSRVESPISIEDDEVVLLTDNSNSMDVDVKIIEETSPVKIPPAFTVSRVEISVFMVNSEEITIFIQSRVEISLLMASGGEIPVHTVSRNEITYIYDE